MICRNCCSENPNDARFCGKCGHPLGCAEQPPGEQSPYIPPCPPQPVNEPDARDLSGMSVASLVIALGSLSLSCCGAFGIAGGVLAIVFGFKSIYSSRRWMSVAGIFVGAASILSGLYWTLVFFGVGNAGGAFGYPFYDGEHFSS